VRRVLMPSTSVCSADTSMASSSAESLLLLSVALDTPGLYTSAIELLKPIERKTTRSVNALAWLLRRGRDALVDHLEDRVAHDDVLVVHARRLRQLELPGVELLVHNDRAGAIPSQHFHRLAAFPHEDEQRLGARLGLHP